MRSAQKLSRSRLQVTTAPSRRDVMTAAIGGGFALAVRPVSAETISTPADGLVAGDVEIPSAAGAVHAYRAKPHVGAGKGKKPPLLLVIHEIFGVHEHIRDVCRRLAKQGFCAVAPDLFARHGDVTKLSDVKQIREVVGKTPDAEVLADLDAVVAWAHKAGEGDTGRLGITGFCWGGRIVWLYAAASPKLKAGVAWYGRLTGDKDAAHPRHPLEVAQEKGKDLQAPVLGLYGGEDQGIPVASVNEMQKALAGGGKNARASEIHVYPQAGHAFFADYRPSYKEDAARDGWGRLLVWLKAHGAS